MDAPTLRAARQAILVDHKPSAEEREFIGSGPDFSSGGGTWSGMIGRTGAGERVACKIVRPANANKGVILWAHPDGCESLSADDPNVKKLLDSGATVLTIDLFPAHATTATKPSNKKDLNPPYAGFVLGYNRSVIANRAHDLLTAFGTGQMLSRDGNVSVVAFGEAGPPALLACAVASHHIRRAAIDLDQFDFDKVAAAGESAEPDPMLLPGALKYGGIYNFASVCDRWDMLLCNARKTGRFDAAAKNTHITIDEHGREPDSMIDWVLR